MLQCTWSRPEMDRPCKVDSCLRHWPHWWPSLLAAVVPPDADWFVSGALCLKTQSYNRFSAKLWSLLTKSGTHTHTAEIGRHIGIQVPQLRQENSVARATRQMATSAHLQNGFEQISASTTALGKAKILLSTLGHCSYSKNDFHVLTTKHIDIIMPTTTPSLHFTPPSSVVGLTGRSVTCA